MQNSPKFNFSNVRRALYTSAPPPKANTNYLQPVECAFSNYQEKENDEDSYTLGATKTDPYKNAALKTPSPSRKTRPIINNPLISLLTKGGNIEQAARKESPTRDNQSISDDDSARRSIDEEEDDESMSTKKKICCNCKKSRCLKLYCDCFARGEICTKECNCVNCLNTESNSEERQNAMMSILDRNPNAFKPKIDKTESPIKVKMILNSINIL